MSTEQGESDAKNKHDDHRSEPFLNGGETDAQPTSKKEEHPQTRIAPLRKSSDPQWWQTFASLILIPVGIVALVIYSRQLHEMQKATKAATDGLALTREMNRLDQRAWVATSGAEGELQVGQPFITRIKYKNTGKTFARNTQIRVKTEIVRKDTLPHFKTLFDPPKDGKEPTTMILAPNADYESITDPLEGSPFSQEQIDNIRDNQELFVFGRIDYVDVFERKHWTTFCYRYSVRNAQYSYCEKHNDADNLYMKKTETREETLERLARDACEGTAAAKRFNTLIKRAAKTPTPAAKSAKESPPNEG